MRFAFAIYHYFPYGGAQRDLLTITRECLARGHQVDIFAGIWQGAKPEGANVHVLDASSFSNNLQLNRHFINWFSHSLSNGHFDLTLGFQRMPGLDCYFAADSCFATKAFQQRSRLYRLTPRARQYLSHENAIFSPGSQTHSLILSQQQLNEYRNFYHTPEERLHLLPPGINRRFLPDERYAEIRHQVREQADLDDDDKIVLFVGSSYKHKGLKRVIDIHAALKQHHQAELWIAGRGETAPYIKQSNRKGIFSQTRFLGSRSDVNQLMWAADALILPSTKESAGKVILEAMVAGIPVLTTDTCGYAHWISQFSMGKVLPHPANQRDAAQALDKLLDYPRQHWQTLAKQVHQQDIFSQSARCVDLLEQLSHTL